jgi:hypothetical protein
MKPFLFICLSLISINAYGQERQMSITVDDLPDVRYGNNDPNLPHEIANGLISA